MSLLPEDPRLRSYDHFRGEAKHFFEVQMEPLGLDESQIGAQGIAELEDSLVRVDDALRHPESFGVLRLSVSGNTSIVIARANTESHVEIGVVPLLLERKKQILDLLRTLRSQRPVRTITDLIDNLADADLREQLWTELEATRKSSHTVGMNKDVRANYAFIAMAMDPQDPQLEDVLDAIKGRRLKVLGYRRKNRR